MHMKGNRSEQESTAFACPVCSIVQV